MGFGGNAVDAAHIQLPFMVVFLVFSAATAYIISKLGKVKPTVFGGAISIAGAIGLLMFHSTGFLVSANLTIIAIGLALTTTTTWNLIVSSAPKEFMGISTGIGALLLSIGMAIGPALAGTVHANIPYVDKRHCRLVSFSRVLQHGLPYSRCAVSRITSLIIGVKQKIAKTGGKGSAISRL